MEYKDSGIVDPTNFTHYKQAELSSIDGKNTCPFLFSNKSESTEEMGVEFYDFIDKLYAGSVKSSGLTILSCGILDIFDPELLICLGCCRYVDCCCYHSISISPKLERNHKIELIKRGLI